MFMSDSRLNTEMASRKNKLISSENEIISEHATN